MIRIVCLYGLFALSVAFLSEGPCDLEPARGGSHRDANYTAKIRVPKSCTNGTFVWHYPGGNVYLLFKDYKRSTAVCFRTPFGDNIFKIYDATSGHKMRLLPIPERNNDKSVCTTAAVGRRLKIRVYAEPIYYMGKFAFYLVFAPSSATMYPL
ncbi:uncharacterized protein LOC127842582 [Dreissena polymorpha]|uniref:Salivary lipocalin n=1 Tax=Dreissena polymorpha TaxID=45954 RepID=A0A9D4IX11_DREPO|nr:uncharacterized protein LOC127842582 [Dreissena polymorpha]KAH3787702.1 hypothetical protein DPMN_165829 [Dreissena polymorpha]